MGRKAPIGKGKVIATGTNPMAKMGDLKSQGGIPPSGRIDRGGSNAGKGNKVTGTILPSDKGAKY